MLTIRPVRVVTTTLATCFALLSLALVTHAEDEHLGEIEFEIACMPCHGLNGKGHGPKAQSLAAALPDLTQLAKSNSGKFPFERVVAVIDGRKQVAAHGQRAMPVWGDRYRIFAEPGESQQYVERRGRLRIRALARYVEKLQEK